MFNKDFYPTPEHVVEKMIRPHLINSCLKARRVLDPSAGKGNILDTINKLAQRNKSNNKLYAVEIEAELQSILLQKGYQLLGDDFLRFQTHIKFDLIVMNPPFRCGAKHLLHAWHISQGGSIVCLLNAKTVRNAYTRERKELASIISTHGSVEEIGSVFVDAERKTSVECVIVRLEKQDALLDADFLFAPSDTETHGLGDDTFSQSELAKRDIIASYIQTYNAAIDAKREAMKAAHKLDFYVRDFYAPYRNKYREFDIRPKVSETPAKEFQEWLDEFTANAWHTIMNKTAFKRYLTSSVLAAFEEKFESQTQFAFTKQNILNTLEALRQNASNLMTSSIEQCFDDLTRHHHDNREMIEGWKTNQAWYVADKFILPCIVEPVFSSDALKVQWDSRYVQIVKDLETCLAFLCSIDTSEESGFVSFEAAINEASTSGKKSCTSTFFDIKFFKKGTAHFKFKSEWLRSEFNYLAAQRKGFPLPEKMKRKASDPQPSSQSQLLMLN